MYTSMSGSTSLTDCIVFVLGVPEYIVTKSQIIDPAPAGNSAGAQRTPNSGEPSTTTVKTAADDLLKFLKSSKQQPSTAIGGKQVSLLNSIQKLLTAYASGNAANAKKAESPKPTSVSSSRRSSLTDLLKIDESGKASPSEQVVKAAQNDGEHSIKIFSLDTKTVEDVFDKGVSSPKSSATKDKMDTKEVVLEVTDCDKEKVDADPEKTTTSEKISSKPKVSEIGYTLHACSLVCW